MTGDARVIHARSNYLRDDELATGLSIANLDTVFKSWDNPSQNKAIQRWDDNRRPQPWPEDPIEQLVWLVTSGAKVWCPKTRQLDELKAKRLRDRAHPDGIPKPRPERQVLNEALRAGYYDRRAPKLNHMSRPPELLAQLGVPSEQHV